RADLEAIVSEEKSIEITAVPTAPGVLYNPHGSAIASCAACKFEGTIDRTWGISSFTSLLTGAEPERPDYDEADARELSAEPDQPAHGMFAFPRGAKAGTCLHYIFEELDFSDLSTMPALVNRRLQMFGIHGF